MKKVQKWLILVLCLALLGAFGSFAIACGDDEAPAGDGKLTVTFVDGNTVLSTQKVEKGGKVTEPVAPTKSGYEFVRWCATPTFSQPFDFDMEIEQNTRVFAGFRSTAADDHTWYLLGESKVSKLFSSNHGWTAVDTPNAEVTFTKDAAAGNKFSITVDLYTGDMFKIVNTENGWNSASDPANKPFGEVGYGYMNSAQYNNEYLEGIGTPFSDAAKKSNISVKQDGNYKITLTVDAAWNLTELSVERLGDAEDLGVQYNYYIKGKYITDWNNMFVEYTKFTETTDSTVYELTIGMKAGDEFMFMSAQKSDPEQVGSNNVSAFILSDDEKTAAAIEAGAYNFNVTGGTGTYKFIIDRTDVETDLKPTLKAEKTAETVPAYDYYIKGNMKGGDTEPDSSWQKRYKMTLGTGGVYSYTMAMEKDDMFQVTVTERGVPSVTTGADKFSITAAYANPKNTSVNIDTTSNNFKVLKSDTFTVTIDPVNMLVSVVGENDPVIYSVMLHGKFAPATGWKDSAEKATVEVDKGLSCTITKTLTSGDAFGVKTTKEGSSAQIGWGNAASGDAYTFTGCDGIEGTRDITCTADGTYVFNVTLSEDGQIVSVVVTAKAA